jgi:GNAT superfamily N-acetyltransferase
MKFIRPALQSLVLHIKKIAMNLREATPADIPGIQLVRNAVKENRLSDPALVSDKDCEDYITRRGKGWVCEEQNRITGFSIVDLTDHNVWALFVHPDYEAKGIGRLLHDTMLNWYFSKTDHTLWLSTTPATRAEQFYRRAGWKENGLYGKGEIRFEMSAAEWQQQASK